MKVSTGTIVFIIILVGIIFLLICGAFYWVEIRPGKIIKECYKTHGNNITEEQEFREGTSSGFIKDSYTTTITNNFEGCLHEKGIK